MNAATRASEGRRVLVTGAAGFIGSHTAEALLRRGDSVVGLDNLDPYYDPGVKLGNLEDVHRTAAMHSGSFEAHEIDLCDAAGVEKLIREEGITSVIHLAAKAGVRPSIADPVGYTRANLLGTSSVLEACKAGGVDRIVVASSSSVYGNNEKVPFAEDDPVEHPISPYASTKRGCELLCHTHHHLTGAAVGCLRFFTVFGPRQRPDLAISLFLDRVSRGETITMFGDGSMSRDFTFVDDIVSGVVAAHDRIHEHGYRIWNLGGSSPHRLDELIATVARVVEREPVIEPKPQPPGDVDRTWSDPSRAMAELGWQPTTDLETDVRAQWAWMQDRVATGGAR